MAVGRKEISEITGYLSENSKTRPKLLSGENIGTHTQSRAGDACVYVPEMCREVFNREHIEGVPANDGEPTEDAGEDDSGELLHWEHPDQ